MNTLTLGRLLAPKSIAVVGIQDKSTNLALTLLGNLLQHNFQGKIYPVGTDMNYLGVKAYASLHEIPFRVDLVIWAGKRANWADFLVQLIAKGCKHLLLLSKGEMTDLHTHNLKVIGPESLGYINAELQIFASPLGIGYLPGQTALLTNADFPSKLLLQNFYANGIGLSHFVDIGTSVDSADPADSADAADAAGDGGGINLSNWLQYFSQHGRTKSIVITATTRSDILSLKKVTESLDLSNKRVLIYYSAEMLSSDSELLRAVLLMQAQGIVLVSNFSQLLLTLCCDRLDQSVIAPNTLSTRIVTSNLEFTSSVGKDLRSTNIYEYNIRTLSLDNTVAGATSWWKSVSKMRELEAAMNYIFIVATKTELQYQVILHEYMQAVAENANLALWLSGANGVQLFVGRNHLSLKLEPGQFCQTLMGLRSNEQYLASVWGGKDDFAAKLSSESLHIPKKYWSKSRMVSHAIVTNLEQAIMFAQQHLQTIELRPAPQFGLSDAEWLVTGINSLQKLEKALTGLQHKLYQETNSENPPVEILTELAGDSAQSFYLRVDMSQGPELLTIANNQKAISQLLTSSSQDLTGIVSECVQGRIISGLADNAPAKAITRQFSEIVAGLMASNQTGQVVQLQLAIGSAAELEILAASMPA